MTTALDLLKEAHVLLYLAAQDSLSEHGRAKASDLSVRLTAHIARESAQVESVAPPDQRQAVVDAIASALGDAYDCTRVWAAWCAGTMTEDDFVQVAEQEDRLLEIADAAIAAMPSAAPQPAPAVPTGWKLVPVEPTERMIAEVEGAARIGGIWTAASAYRAMLEVAPTPPKGE